jgi:hypothetical protein
MSGLLDQFVGRRRATAGGGRHVGLQAEESLFRIKGFWPARSAMQAIHRSSLLLNLWVLRNLWGHRGSPSAPKRRTQRPFFKHFNNQKAPFFSRLNLRGPRTLRPN